jgi:hypothetical protein
MDRRYDALAACPLLLLRACSADPGDGATQAACIGRKKTSHIVQTNPEAAIIKVQEPKTLGCSSMACWSSRPSPCIRHYFPPASIPHHVPRLPTLSLSPSGLQPPLLLLIANAHPPSRAAAGRPSLLIIYSSDLRNRHSPALKQQLHTL